VEGKVRCHIGLWKSAGRRMKCGPEEASFFGVSERGRGKVSWCRQCRSHPSQVRERWGSRSTGGIKEVQKLAKFRGRATRRSPIPAQAGDGAAASCRILT